MSAEFSSCLATRLLSYTIQDDALRSDDCLIEDALAGADKASLSMPQLVQRVLASPALRRLLETLENRYDCVVVDSAPVLPVSDALNFAQRGLRTFLVARSEHTTTRELRESGRRIEAVGGQEAPDTRPNP